ncbi:hypothetical protein ARMA_1802 [Ardenticatena maritima]|uniref:Uncharacterized protein n=1 Tax=Ardenticatena maritima TaxID=872965 RepID=A0A0M9UCZ8_9CHLR|nr:hypothetical protein ARMA_1802 [Ardenticatena maritima]
MACRLCYTLPRGGTKVFCALLAQAYGQCYFAYVLLVYPKEFS